MKSFSQLFLLSALTLTASAAMAQQAEPAAGAAAAPQPWTYKTKQLDRAQIDALLAHPKKIVVLDVRRPDELSKNGAFPAYINIQAGDVEKSLDYLPKDRTIITVSNHAHRAGAAGDLLSKKGYKVAGAAGTLDYEEQGGKLSHVVAPVLPVASAGAAATPAK